jgi:hypothetical protein
MALEDLEKIWHQQQLPQTMDKDEITKIIQGRFVDTRRLIGQKLRNDILIYSFLVVLPIGQLISRGMTIRTLASLGYGMAIYALLIAPQVYKQRQMRNVTVTDSLEKSLKNLIRSFRVLIRTYMIAYMTAVVLSVGILEALLATMVIHGALMFALSIAVSLIFILFMFVMGRLHLMQGLGKQKMKLLESLADLQKE